MLVVCTQANACEATVAKAHEFVQRTGLPWIAAREDAKELALVFEDAQIALHARARSGESSKKGWLRPLVVAFDLLDVHSPSGRRGNQPLAKAIGRKGESTPVSVIDATAGLGQDSWLLAALGCRVLAVERSPVVAALLRDGLERAAKTHPEIAARIALLEMDACALSTTGVDAEYDVVYLDPMFPARSKSALEKKEMRLLRRIVGADLDAKDLFAWARERAKKRIVVKRPAQAVPLVPNPTVSHRAKGIRYDVYSIATLS